MGNCSIKSLRNDDINKRKKKEAFFNQKSKVIWMTGLSSSGKTTIAKNLDKKLQEMGFFTQLFDGDFLRKNLNKDLDYSLEGREENIRRAAEISKMFLNAGIVVISSFISPTKKIRQLAKDIIGSDDFIEVYVNSSFETCESRDKKGIYEKARKGFIKNFTGIDSPYEVPENPDIEINTEEYSIETLVKELSDFIIPKISLCKANK